jgi:hypothetical protein
MIAPSKLILGRQLRPVRMHCQEARMRLGPRAEAKSRLRLSQIAPDRLPVGSFSCGSVWHRSGETA